MGKRNVSLTWTVMIDISNSRVWDTKSGTCLISRLFWIIFWLTAGVVFPKVPIKSPIMVSNVFWDPWAQLTSQSVTEFCFASVLGSRIIFWFLMLFCFKTNGCRTTILFRMLIFFRKMHHSGEEKAIVHLTTVVIAQKWRKIQNFESLESFVMSRNDLLEYSSE